MDFEAVYRQFLLFAGLDAEGGMDWRPLCAAAADSLADGLRPGANAADPRLVLAAAGEAFHRYALARAGAAPQTVRVGDVSYAEGDGPDLAARAQSLRDALFAGAAPLLDCGFAGLWVTP